jgi:hypothetical protein
MTEPVIDPQLAAFLARRDHPCPQCEYNLRDLQGNRCPECGEELVLRVNMAEPRQRLLLAGLIGLSSGAGFNGLLLIYVLLEMIRFSRPMPREFWTTIFAGFCFFSAIIFVWLRFWRPLRRQSLLLRFALMCGCWLAALVDIIIFSLTIR